MANPLPFFLFICIIFAALHFLFNHILLIKSTLNSFRADILQDKPIKMFNHGFAKRDFTYIDDIVSGVIACLDHQTQFEIFNLGNNKPVELKTFISTIESILGKKAIIDSVPMQKGDVPLTYANITKAELLLKYHPKTSIEEGLTKFVNWYKSSFMEIVSGDHKPNAVITMSTEKYERCAIKLLNQIRTSGEWTGTIVYMVTYSIGSQTKSWLDKNRITVFTINRTENGLLPSFMKSDIFTHKEFRKFKKLLYLEPDHVINSPIQSLFDLRMPENIWIALTEMNKDSWRKEKFIHEVRGNRRFSGSSSSKSKDGISSSINLFVLDVMKLPYEGAMAKKLLDMKDNANSQRNDLDFISKMCYENIASISLCKPPSIDLRLNVSNYHRNSVDKQYRQHCQSTVVEYQNNKKCLNHPHDLFQEK
jgi:hypothetical protein